MTEIARSSELLRIAVSAVPAAAYQLFYRNEDRTDDMLSVFRFLLSLDLLEQSRTVAALELALHAEEKCRRVLVPSLRFPITMVGHVGPVPPSDTGEEGKPAIKPFRSNASLVVGRAFLAEVQTRIRSSGGKLPKSDEPSDELQAAIETAEHEKATRQPHQDDIRARQEFKKVGEMRGSPWRFWYEWYLGFLNGERMDSGLLRRILTEIPGSDWEKGPQHIARVIEALRAPEADDKPPVPANDARNMAERLTFNRDALALLASGLLDQIDRHRELIRGYNQLDPELRDRLLAFLDDLTGRLNSLLALLPADTARPNEALGEKGVHWLSGFKTALSKVLDDYTNPENVAGALIPTGIILISASVGALLGNSLTGAAVGGLLTGQLKPGKAAEDILRGMKKDGEP